jgi:hypothetical protein
MSQTSFQDLFNAALQDYENQTGTSLINHPFAKQLEACDSVDSITAFFKNKAQIFRKFRGDDGKLMKSLNCSVDVLYTLSTTILGEGIGLVSPNTFISVLCFQIVILQAFPPANAIFTGIAVLLAVCSFPQIHLHIFVTSKSRRRSKTFSASYGALIDFFAVLRELPRQA